MNFLWVIVSCIGSFSMFSTSYQTQGECDISFFFFFAVSVFFSIVRRRRRCNSPQTSHYLLTGSMQYLIRLITVPRVTIAIVFSLFFFLAHLFFLSRFLSLHSPDWWGHVVVCFAFSFLCCTPFKLSSCIHTRFVRHLRWVRYLAHHSLHYDNWISFLPTWPPYHWVRRRKVEDVPCHLCGTLVKDTLRDPLLPVRYTRGRVRVVGDKLGVNRWGGRREWC
jgi:hypothetical protein